MNNEKLIELFLYKIKAELYDIKAEIGRVGNNKEIMINCGNLDKIYNWIDDIIIEIEGVLK